MRVCMCVRAGVFVAGGWQDGEGVPLPFVVDATAIDGVRGLPRTPRPLQNEVFFL